MKITKITKILLFFAFFIGSKQIVFSQLPDCNSFYIHSNSSIYTINPTTFASTQNSIPMPSGGSGLAVNNNLNAATPATTFYTVINGIYWYYNGTTWVSTGHSSGSTAAVNPGGAGPYIYNLVGGSGTLYRYDGTGNSTVFLNLSGFGGPYDVIGDQYGNVYVLFNTSGNQNLVMYNSSGQVVCTYALVNLPSSSAGGGYAIVNGLLYANVGSSNHVGTISGSTITFTTANFNTSGASDFANCPFPLVALNLTPSAITFDVCLGDPFTITGTTSVVNPTWSWTGPGIISGANTATITVNQPGVYIANVTSSAGCSGNATNQYTVVASGSPPPVITQPTPKCINTPAFQLAVTGISGTYSSSCGPCLSSTGVFDPAVAGIGSHTVTYAITGTCAGSDTKTIVVNDLPTVSAGADVTICAGVPTNLTGTGANTYAWSSGDSTTVASVSPLNTTTYTMIGTDINGCSASDSVVITTTPSPVPSITGTLTYCAGSNTTLTGASGFPTYTWSTGSSLTDAVVTIANNPITLTVTDTLGCEGTTVPLNVVELSNSILDTTINICQGDSLLIHGISRNTTGLYSASFTAANGCDSTANINLIVHAMPTIDAGLDQEICFGESAILTATGSTFYIWDNGLALGATHTVTPTLPGSVTYTVIGSDIYGCYGMDNVVVTMDLLPVVGAGADIVICSGETVTLTASGASTYVWSNGVVNGVSFQPTVSQLYTVVGTSAYGCDNQDVVQVIVNPTSTVSFTGTDLTGCVPVTSSFLANVSENNSTFFWEFGDGLTSNATIFTNHTYESPGCYDVKLTVTTDKGCVSVYEMPSFVCTYSNPVANFMFSETDLISYSTTTNLLNLSTNAVAYQWDFGDGSPESNEFSPEHTFPGPEAGGYYVTLIAITPNGCTDTIRKLITVDEELIYYIPNAFTPDGNEYNDTFKPVFSIGIDPNDFSMYIYNRWGQIIFETHDIESGWDGTYNGESVQDGLYTYSIQYKIARKDDYRTIQGHFTKIQ